MVDKLNKKDGKTMDSAQIRELALQQKDSGKESTIYKDVRVTDQPPVYYQENSVQVTPEATVEETTPKQTTTVSNKTTKMNAEQLAEFLKNDSNYQNFYSEFQQMDARMAEIENKYNMKRSNSLSNFYDHTRMSKEEAFASLRNSSNNFDYSQLV